MKENVYLIKEINDLKREKKILKDEMAKKQSQTATSISKKKNMSGLAPENNEEVVSAQRIELKQLQDKLKEMSQKNQELKDRRPPSSGSKVKTLKFFAFAFCLEKLAPVMEIKP